MNQLPNLLIVDDIKANLLLLRSVTKKLELNLIEASSGSEALEKSQGMELALAIIDVRMPEMDGYELAKKLNEGRHEDKVPVIFLTANYLNEVELFKGYDSGAVDYIINPINSRVLLSKINIFLDLFNQKQTIKWNAAELEKSSEELKKSLDQLHPLTQHVEKVRENERVAISRELHDDLGIIKQKIQDGNLLLKMNKVTALVSDTIKTVQRITAQLRPDIIDDLGFVPAVEWYAKEFSERTGIEVIPDLDLDVSISPDTSLTLFRIVQKQLTNIALHSEATRAGIFIGRVGETIELNISDNGKGITIDEIESKKSFGIMSMKEKASSVVVRSIFTARQGMELQ